MLPGWKIAADGVMDRQVLMCHYMFFAEIDGPRWALMGLVVKLAQSVSSAIVASSAKLTLLLPQVGLRQYNRSSIRRYLIMLLMFRSG
jgi:hypothetical protein